MSQEMNYPDVGFLDNLIFNGNPAGDENLFLGDGEQFQDFEIDTKMIIPMPLPSNVISNEEYPGPYDFEVCIIPVPSHKQPWVFSHTLNKVFMDMANPFPIDFKIKEFASVHEQLYVRATPVYMQTQFLHDLVHRCINHEYMHDPTNKDVSDPIQRQHIIRCKNPNRIYQGDKNHNERLSVIIPLSSPEAGTDSVKEMYEFVCKNSCPAPGMNRRHIQIIFTLENVNGDIFGRRVLNVRICSCPKRDKEKEETELQKNKQNPAVPHGKKRKLNNIKTEKKVSPDLKDNKEYELNLKIVGKHNVQQVIKYCQDLMAGEILRNEPHNAPFKKCLNELQQLGKE